MKNIIISILFAYSTTTSAQVHSGFTTKQLQSAERKISATLTRTPTMFRTWRTQSERIIRLENVDCSQGRVNLRFNEGIIQIPIREQLCKQWEQMIRDTLSCYISPDYSDAIIGIFYKSAPIERFIPNFYRSKIKPDAKRLSSPIITAPLVKQLDKQIYGKGLYNRHIALWPSHGYYMDFEDSTWKFQRPSLFGTVEDLHTYFNVDNYLIPMLENAGAVVITPRERDINPNEIIIDADYFTSSSGNISHNNKWIEKTGGYKHQDTLFTQNPFTLGNYFLSPANGGTISYETDITASGNYAVYVSYKPLPTNDNRAKYTVFHAQGETSFEVNQQIGGGWVYLGKFPFDKHAVITLTSNKQITADAVKIGGGIGSTYRLNSSSGVPRWAEGARYFMQYSGVPESIYRQDLDNKRTSDYMDDYKSRGDWVNYLKDSQKIPVDLALALHSNSGIVDSIFGTLVINYTSSGSATYSNEKSKYAARDLADIVQTQIVDDLRSLYDSAWTRRSIYDKQYAEISRPDVPAVIIEMFSHQNMNDMRHALTPRFRFDINRAIYKGTLKFITSYYKLPYVVQPLPPSDFYLDVRHDNLSLRWTATSDPLEPTANATYFTINNIPTQVPLLDIPIIRDGVMRHYAVVSHNDGGRSFTSDTLRACFYNNNLTSLIIKDIPLVTSFDTLSNPKNYRGLVINPQKSLYDDYSIVGKQIDFDPKSPFIENPTPGWGASDYSLLFKGLKNNLTTTLNTLYKALIKAQISFIETNHKAIPNLEISPADVYIISTLSKDEIEEKYKSVFNQTTNIHYISAFE